MPRHGAKRFEHSLVLDTAFDEMPIHHPVPRRGVRIIARIGLPGPRLLDLLTQDMSLHPRTQDQTGGQGDTDTHPDPELARHHVLHPFPGLPGLDRFPRFRAQCLIIQRIRLGWEGAALPDRLRTTPLSGPSLATKWSRPDDSRPISALLIGRLSKYKDAKPRRRIR